MWDQLLAPNTRLLSFESLNTVKIFPWRFSHQHTNVSSLISTAVSLPVTSDKYQIKCHTPRGSRARTHYSIQLSFFSSSNQYLTSTPIIHSINSSIIIKISSNSSLPGWMCQIGNTMYAISDVISMYFTSNFRIRLITNPHTFEETLHVTLKNYKQYNCLLTHPLQIQPQQSQDLNYIKTKESDTLILSPNPYQASSVTNHVILESEVLALDAAYALDLRCQEGFRLQKLKPILSLEREPKISNQAIVFPIESFQSFIFLKPRYLKLAMSATNINKWRYDALFSSNIDKSNPETKQQTKEENTTSIQGIKIKIIISNYAAIRVPWSISLFSII